MEPWVSGGTTSSGIVVSHSRDLPCVYGFIWRLHPGYTGPISEGDMVIYPRYAYEVFATGSGLGEDGEPQHWELAVISTDAIEAIVPLSLFEDPGDDPFDVMIESVGANKSSPESRTVIR